MKITINERDLATLLAALRVYQDKVLNKTGGFPPGILDIATDCGEMHPLNADEVDELCERLNCAPRGRKAKA